MKLFPPYKRSLIALLALCLVFGATEVSANVPRDVADLVGARGSSGESELGQRGYSYVTMTHGVQYWWNAGSKSCIGIKIAQGRYQSVSAASAAQCKQGGGSASKPSSHATQNAETACMTKINTNYGGHVKELKVVRAEFSEANTEVIVDAVGARGQAKTERWRCLASSHGKVADLSILP